MKEKIKSAAGALGRRDFISGALGVAALGCSTASETIAGQAAADGDILDAYQRETDLVSPKDFIAYFKDGDTRGFAALEKLEAAFEKVFGEARSVEVKDVPAVWSVYNMGYIVKTREAMFAIDLFHRRAAEFAPFLDFSLVTHAHGDHYQGDLYRAMNAAGKTVISNFLDNTGVKSPRKNGGYTRAEKVFRIKDVEIRTSLVDHNSYLLDYTTAFEIRVGDWKLYHTGDCSIADKLRTTWGAPDLWLLFPMGALNVSSAVERVRPERIVFGHIWEMAHSHGARLSTKMLLKDISQAGVFCNDVKAGLWGERLV